MTIVQLSHYFDAKHAKNLGQQSVSNNVVAIFEVVKNAYDADTGLVEVIFVGDYDYNKKLKINQIKIRDDGVGMTFEDIRDKWMRVGTDFKEQEPYSPIYKRRVVGEKGIGHFATQRLGSKITVISEPKMYAGRETKYPDSRLALIQDWDRYEAGKVFEEIKDSLEITEKTSKLAHGVEIIIEQLNDTWTEDDIWKLRDRLGVLVLPDEIAKDVKHPFKCKIITEGFGLPDVEIQSNLFKKAPFRFEAKLRNGQIYCTIYDFGEKVNKNPTDGPIPLDGASCGEVDFKLYDYPQDDPNAPKKVFERHYSKVMGASAFSDTLKEHSGIKIYNDNVRIMPYGEPGNDWMQLNMRRIQKFGAHRVTNKDVIGFVLLSREKNRDIKETTTREALEDNKAFKDLQEFINKSLHEYERYRHPRIIELSEKNKKKTIVDNALSAKVDLNMVKQELQDLSIPREAEKIIHQHISKASKSIETLEKEHEKEVDELSSTVSVYRNISTMGLSTIAFNHEIVDPLISMNLKVASLIEDLDANNISYDDRKEKLFFLSNTIANQLHWANYIKAFTGLIAGKKQRRREIVPVKETIEGILKAHDYVLTINDIQVRKSLPGYVKELYMNRADFESIIMNLFTNSVKSLKQVKHERMIKIEFDKTTSHLKLWFTDNGVGIHSSDFERIFEPFYTTYNDPEKGIQGTGMGLPIIREILEDYDGEIKVDESHPGRGATFLISIPLETVKKHG